MRHRCREQTYGHQGGKAAGGGGGGVMNWAIGIDMYTLCIKWISNKNLLHKKINKIKFKKKERKKEELNNWRTIPYSWTRRLNIVEMSALLNLIHRFNTIPVRTPASYFVDIGKLILKWRGQRPRIANSILKESNKIRGLTLPDLKTYLKAIVIETVWYW